MGIVIALNSVFGSAMRSHARKIDGRRSWRAVFIYVRRMRRGHPRYAEMRRSYARMRIHAALFDCTRVPASESRRHCRICVYFSEGGDNASRIVDRSIKRAISIRSVRRTDRVESRSFTRSGLCFSLSFDHRFRVSSFLTLSRER